MPATTLAALIATGFVAGQHIMFLVLEMFLWDTPTGRRVFRMTPEQSAVTRTLAINQGVYNGFLAAGLAWGIWLGAEGVAIRLFFLACVVVAGAVGAATVSRRIVVVQAVPALVALGLTLLS